LVVVDVLAAGEDAHGPREGVDDLLRGGVVRCVGQGVGKAFFAELLRDVVAGFGDAVGVQQQALGRPQVDMGCPRPGSRSGSSPPSELRAGTT